MIWTVGFDELNPDQMNVTDSFRSDKIGMIHLQDLYWDRATLHTNVTQLNTRLIMVLTNIELTNHGLPLDYPMATRWSI